MSRLNAVLAIVLLLVVGCDGPADPSIRGEGGSGGWAGGTGGDAGAGGDGGTGGEAGSGGTGGTGGDAGSGGTGGIGGDAGSGGTGGIGGDAGSGGVGEGGTGGSAGGEGGAGGTAGEGGAGGVGGAGGSGDAGAGGGGSGGHEPQSIDVTGTVFFGEAGNPLEGATVWLNRDPSRKALTNAQGEFEFAQVMPPYDITITTETYWALLEHRGLTRPAPAFVVHDDVRQGGIVNGFVSGPTIPIPRDADVSLGLVGTQPFSSWGSVEKYTGYVSGTLFWTGLGSYSGTLVGVHTQRRAGGGLEFLAAGLLDPFSIDNAAREPIGSLAIDSPIATGVTDVLYDPSLYPFPVRASVGTFTTMAASFPAAPIADRFSAPPVGLPVPLEGATLTLEGLHPGGDVAVQVEVPAEIGGVTRLELPASLSLEILQPALGAANVSITPTLEWTPVPDATAYRIEVYGWDRFGLWIVPPEVTRLDVPDHGPASFRLASGRNIIWRVIAFHDRVHSADDVTDPASPGTPTRRLPSLTHHAEGTFTTSP